MTDRWQCEGGYTFERVPLRRLFPHMKSNRLVYSVMDPEGNYQGYVFTQREARLLVRRCITRCGVRWEPSVLARTA